MTADHHRILVTARYAPDELRRLERIGHVRHEPWDRSGHPRDAEQLRALVAAADPTILVVELDAVDETVLAHPGLRLVGVCRGMPSGVDLDAAARRGIEVLRTPGRNAQAVAELVVASVVWLLRNGEAATRWVADGRWDGSERASVRFRGGELHGRTVALLGLGAVPRRLAPILSAFGCRLIGHDPGVAPGEVPGVELTSLEQAVAGADVVSIHLPRAPQTQGLISARLIATMRPGAIVVNSARAAVVDNDALHDALAAGRLAGAVLDVFDEEPPGAREARLIALPNVLATPHIGGATAEVIAHHSAAMTAGVAAWAAGDPLPPAVARAAAPQTTTKETVS